MNVVGELARKTRQAAGTKPFWMTLQIAWSGVVPTANPYAMMYANPYASLTSNPYSTSPGYENSGYYNPYMYSYDPYSGYLRGAADVINAQGRFLVSTQQPLEYAFLTSWPASSAICAGSPVEPTMNSTGKPSLPGSGGGDRGIMRTPGSCESAEAASILSSSAVFFL